jgi:cytochrome c553
MLFMATAGAAQPVAAQPDAAQPAAIDFQAMSWASSCVTCHGAETPIKGSSVVSLVGMPAGAIESAMRAYASGERAGPLMQQIAKGYDEATIKRIAQWYASIKKETP